jgi:AraC-like DNA-binding protein
MMETGVAGATGHTDTVKPAQPARISVREMIREKIRIYVDRHLRDPDLSIDAIAGSMNCTKRYLHKVFSNGNETLSRYIWSARLDRCRSDLDDPSLRHKSISEIAFSWGFNNSAHFSRVFRGRFGASPRRYRGRPRAA